MMDWPAFVVAFLRVWSLLAAALVAIAGFLLLTGAARLRHVLAVWLAASIVIATAAGMGALDGIIVP